MPADKEYRDTKLIIKGKTVLKSPFLEFANWLSIEYGVNVLNIVYDKVIPDNRPRLQIILKKRNELLSFQEKDSINFDRMKQKKITEKFVELVKSKNINQFDTNSIFSVFSAFDSIALIEANENISNWQIEELISNYSKLEIWKIERSFGAAVCFFYKNQQLENAINKGKTDLISSSYFNLLKRFDEFSLIERDLFTLSFDSKENFDRNYNGNWFNYWR
ncbi:hypothetical protein AB3N61_18565 [Leptospira sp. WS58.C1]|uniref:hypothetical protein n=1 Tax=Leptospira cinconiae TaxID=3235173 RepID=UPI00349E554D